MSNHIAPRARFLALALTTTCLSGIAHAGAPLPVGGSVSSGSAQIGTNGTTTTVTQTSAKAVVNWQGFDVGAGNAVVFAQPNAQSATLNRVTGATTSTIAGSITSNGAVYLVNPNGIAITSTGSVQTGGGFIASTLDITDSDFNKGKLNFTGNGASKGVTNAGSIAAGSGAYVALLGGSVSNSGTISVPLGRVGLGSGEQIALDLNGDGFMQVAVPTNSVTGGALIDMSGSITAAGGRVELRAAALKDAVRNIVNVPGSISADSATGDAGSIVLIAGGDTANLAGTLTATGTLTARATGATGNGGAIETSGENVAFKGLNIDTSAAHGTTGSWLIDPSAFAVTAAPTDLTVGTTTDATTLQNALATTNVTLRTTFSTPTYTGVAPFGETASGSGNITISTPLTWSSANTLTLAAYNNIMLNSAITATNGGLTLTAGNGGANTGAITATGAVNVGVFNLTNGAWTQNSATLPSFSATDFRFNPANATFLRVTGGSGGGLGAPYSIADVYGLQGIASSTQLANAFVLAKNIDATGTAAWNAGLGFSPIGTIGTSSRLNNGKGFTGSFDGGNFVISNLTINRPTSSYVGLFGYSDGTGVSIANVGLTGGSMTGASGVGALIGYINVGAISNAYSTGTVTGTYNVGGLIGEQDGGTLTKVHATGNVSLTGTGGYQAGGLAGRVGATVSYAYATGNVASSGNDTGGLIGTAYGSVTDSYATGNVSSTRPSVTTATGGLIGLATGSVTNAYATGSVTETGGSGSTGGLVGNSNGAISSSYATGLVAGNGYVGGLVGSTTSTIGASYWDSYSTGQAQALGSATNVAGVTAVTSDPAQSAAANYAYNSASYANLTASSGIGTATPAGFVFLAGNSTRPFLAFEVPTSSTVATNASSQLVLTNSHQLQLVGYDGTRLSGSYALGNTIDLTETGRVTVGTPASYSGMWAGTGFVSIGTDGAGNIWDGTAFSARGASSIGYTGAFNGGGYTLSNLTIARPAASFTGLFGFISTSTVSNLTVGGTVTGSDNAGGVIGRIGPQAGSTVTGVVSTANVSGVGLFFGGLIGFAENGAVLNSSASGTVSGNSTVGGLIGGFSGTSVTGSFASGAVTATGGNVGGLIGYSNNGGSILTSSASGNVSGTSNVGGLVGQALRNTGSAAAISQSSATGIVTGSSTVTGGLVGFLNGYTVDHSFATGNVYATGAFTRYAGGLVGEAMGSNATYSGAISSSYATGTVTAAVPGGTTYVGGLVGYVANANSVITGSFATGNVTIGSTASTESVGGLVGNGGANISTSYATGALSIGQAPSSTSAYIGGLVGFKASSTTIDRTWASGSITYTGVSTANMSLGGLVGFATGGTGTISRSYATGAVSGGSYAKYAGGLVGYNASTLSQDYASGAVGGGQTQGGLVGINSGTVNSTNYWDQYSTGQMLSTGGGVSTAIPVTSDSTQSALPNYAYKASAYGNFTPADWVFFNGQTRPFGAWEVPASGGTIVNSHQLQLIGAPNGVGLSGSYTIGIPIDLTETGVNIGNASTSSGMWAQTGFVPIGTDGAGNVWNGSAFVSGGTTGFSGSLDGKGLTLLNVTIARRTTNYIGLFGVSTGTLSNVKLYSASIAGNAVVGDLVGNMLGGSVTGSSATSGSSSGNYFVGGLIGNQSGGTITGSTSSAFVAGLTAFAGGLLGQQAGGTLTSSSSSGAVSGLANTGGLVGYQYTTAGTITNSSATGSVSGTTNVGGLVGYSEGSIATSTASGTVTGGSAIGGLVGRAFSGSITGSGTATTSIVTGTGNDLGGLVGYQDSGNTLTSGTAKGAVNGTASNNYVGGLVGAAYGSTDKSSAQGAVTGNNWVGGAFGLTDGTAQITATTAGGNVTGASYVGGFAGTANNLSNGGIGIDGSSATGNVTGTTDTGGFVGYLTQFGQVTNASAVGMVTGSGDNTGGLIGYSEGLVNLSHAGGAVAGQRWTGGLIGRAVNTNAGGSIAFAASNSYATGTVNGTSDVGGLVGQVDASIAINTTYATGPVTGTGNNVGGLIGTNAGSANSSINASYATGPVSGVTNVGGLIGVQSGGTITNSDASGTVTGTNSVGGLIGLLQGSGSLTSVKAVGNVIGDLYVGGLIGTQNGGDIADAYATGNYGRNGSSTFVGGLIGYQDGGTATRTYSIGTGNGANYGGLVGYQTGTGSITASVWNTQTSEKLNGFGYQNGSPTFSAVGYTTSQMQDPTMVSTVYPGWDFTNVWTLPSTGVYPKLRNGVAH